jgi:antigen flippase
VRRGLPLDVSILMFRAFLTIGTLQAFAILIGVARAKLLAVMLGPEGVGVISTVDQVVQSAAYFTVLSLPFAALKFLSRAHSEGEESFRKTYASFLKAMLLLATVGTAIACAVAMSGGRLLRPQAQQYHGLVIIALLAIPATVLGGFFANALAAARRFRASSSLTVITAGVLLVSTIVGLKLGGIPGQYIANVVAGLAVIIGTLIYMKQRLGMKAYDRSASIWKELRESPDIITFAGVMFVATSSYSLAFLVARYSILSTYGEAEAGLLQSALAIGLALSQVLNPVNGLYLTPIMNRRLEPAEKFRSAFEFQRSLVVIMSLASLPVVLFPQVVLAILYSSRFATAAQFVFLFMVWQYLYQLAGINQALLIGLDDLRVYVGLTLIGYLTMAVVAWLTAPSLGITGVALAFITSSGLILILSTLRLKLRYGYSPPGGVNLLTAYGLALTLVAGILARDHAHWTALLVAGRVTLYLLFAGSLLFFLTRAERSALTSLWGRVRFERQ